MRGISLIVLGIVLPVLACGCGMTGSEAQQPPPPETELNKVGLEYRWRLDELLFMPGETVKDMWLRDENLYVLSDTNRLYAVRADRGTLMWSIKMGPPAQTVFPPLHYEGMRLPEKILDVREIVNRGLRPKPIEFDAVLLNTLTRVVVLNQDTGRVYRDIDFGDEDFDIVASTGGATDGSNYYFGATGGLFHCLDLASVVLEWRLSTDANAISAAPVYFQKQLYVGGLDGYLYMVDLGAKPEKRWRTPVEGGVIEGFHVDDRGVFAPAAFNRLHGLHVTTGDEFRGFPVTFNNELRTPVQVGRSTLFQRVHETGLAAINVISGEIRWMVPGGRSVVGVGAGDVFFIDDEGSLHIVDEILGTAKATLRAGGLTRFAWNARTDRLYACTRDGQLRCIQREDAPLPSF